MARKPVLYRQVRWLGDSLDAVKAFPRAVQKRIGRAIGYAQFGGMHPHAKPFRGVGSGVFEIVEPYRTDTYRAVYAVQVGESIYVLHAFQKKAKTGVKTPKQDVELIKQRLKMAQTLEKAP